MAKHYQVKVSDGLIVWKRRTEKIKAEEALDGIYVVRTNVSSSDLGTSETVEAYKSLSFVEQAFRSIKTTSLRIRPIYVYSETPCKRSCVSMYTGILYGMAFET